MKQLSPCYECERGVEATITSGGARYETATWAIICDRCGFILEELPSNSSGLQRDAITEYNQEYRDRKQNPPHKVRKVNSGSYRVEIIHAPTGAWLPFGKIIRIISSSGTATAWKAVTWGSLGGILGSDYHTMKSALRDMLSKLMEQEGPSMGCGK